MSLIACNSKEDQRLNRYIAKINARPPRPIEAIPSFIPIAKFSYPEKDTRRNPFKLKPIIEKDELAPNQSRPKEPLELLPLDALKFVGILEQNNRTWGLISKPDGSLVRVTVGNYMGKNYGQIMAIDDDHLILEETVRVSGKWQKQRITLKMQPASQSWECVFCLIK